MVTIGYYPILPSVLEQIVRLQVRRIQDRMVQNHGVELQIDDALVANIVERCKDPDSGARAVDRILTQGLLPMLSTEILQLMAQGKQMAGAKVSRSPRAATSRLRGQLNALTRATNCSAGSGCWLVRSSVPSSAAALPRNNVSVPFTVTTTSLARSSTRSSSSTQSPSGRLVAGETCTAFSLRSRSAMTSAPATGSSHQSQ